MTDSIDSLSFKPDVKSPLYNTAVQQDVVQGHRSYGGIDVGNTHESYDQAVYQNMRMANLYSMDVEFLILLPTPITLFDRFTFSVDVEQQKQDVAYAGDYIVTAKALFITGATFAEKLIGTRHGTNMDYVSG